MAKSKSDEILAVVRTFLREDGFQAVPVDGTIGMELEEQRGATRIIFWPDEEYDFLQLWAAPAFADEIPEERRQAVMEYLTRANAELVFGNFYLDLDSGEWGFRIAVDYSGGKLTTEMVASIVYCANERVQSYWPGLEKLLGLKK